jgi:hypothetical protein
MLASAPDTRRRFANGMTVHKIDAGSDLDAESLKILGSSVFYVAVKHDTVFLSGGEQALLALNQAMAVTPHKSRP